MSRSFRTLVIGPLRISGAEAHQSPFLVGAPAPTAWAGAAHDIVRRLRQHLPELQHHGTAFMAKPIASNIQRGRGAIRGDNNQVETILLDTLPIELDIGLALALSIPEGDEPFEWMVESSRAEDALFQFLCKNRIFSGIIQPSAQTPHPWGWLSLEDDTSWIMELASKFSTHFRGFRMMVMPDRSWEQNSDWGPVEPGRTDPLLSLLAPLVVQTITDPTSKTNVRTRPLGHNGLIVPAIVGYASVTPGKHTMQPGRRGDGPYQHHFVEPVLGLVQWTQPRWVHSQGLLPFWQHTHRADTGSFLVKPGSCFENPVL